MKRWTIAMLVLFVVGGCGGGGGGGSSGPAVTILASTPYASEPSTSGAFTVIRAGDTTDAMTVNYTVSGTATNGTDYSLLSGSCTIDAGNSTAAIDIAPIDDVTAEKDETVTVTIASGAGYSVGLPGGATVTILDDDSTPTVTIIASDPDAGEPSVHGTFTVSRTGTRVATLTVNYTVSGTATSGVDYSSLSGTCVIDVGSGTALIDVSPIDDLVIEDPESVLLTLMAGGYSIGSPASATVTIADDDTPVVYVDPTGDNSDGTSWAKAFNNCQSGVDAASVLAVADGRAEVWVAAAIYTNGSGRGPVLTMKPKVHIYGGFSGWAGGAGAQETLQTQRNFTVNVTVLDGASRAYRVVIGASTATIDGFSIWSGLADGTGPNNSGGGIYNSGTSLTVANCMFSGNTATSAGGGIYNSSTSLTVANCIFSGNRATDGGGMYNSYFSSATVTNCTFSGNSATYGGGMRNNDSSPTVIDCIFSDNTVTEFGAGMFNSSPSSSSPTVTNCTFSGNSATWVGGGICNDSSSPTISRCTFSNNSAYGGGGMYNLDNSSPTVTNCTFSGNWSTGSNDGGGGMRNYESSPAVTNCIFSGNNTCSLSGGGMRNTASSSPTITNCTFSGNSASSGGGISNSSSSPTVTNCIFWGDIAPTEPEIYNNVTSAPIVTYCDVQGGYTGTGNINLNPLFVDADGPDNTFGTPDDDLRLQALSPCQDAGNDAALPPDAPDLDNDGNTTEPIPYDLDMMPRVAGSFVDMGAYEY